MKNKNTKQILTKAVIISSLAVFAVTLAPEVHAALLVDGFYRPRRTYTPPRPRPKPSPPPPPPEPRYERPPRKPYYYKPPAPKPTPPPPPPPEPTISPQLERFLQKERMMEINYTNTYGSTSSPTTTTNTAPKTTGSGVCILGISHRRLWNPDVLGASSEGEVLGYDCGAGTRPRGSTSGQTFDMSTCGASVRKSCGPSYDPTNYYPNNSNYPSGYNPLVGTNANSGVGWWSAGNVNNSGYTIHPDPGGCGGSSSSHQCFKIRNPDGSYGSSIWVSDARVQNLANAANQQGYYAGSNYGSGSGVYTLTTTSWQCGGMCCYDSGWRSAGGCGAATAPGRRGRGGGEPPVTPPPGCVPSSPTKPAIAHPEDGDTVAPTETVTLSWSLTSWGRNCRGNDNNFFLTVLPSDGSAPLQLVLQATKHDLEVKPGVTYTWFVVASNGSGSRASDNVSFTVSETSLISGYVSGFLGTSCAGDYAASEIQPSELTSGVAVSAGTINGTWDPAAFDNHSYEIENVGFGSGQTICANVSDPVDKPNFRYVLNCVNGSDTGIISGSCASVDVTSAATTANLGYRLASTGWFQSIGGDVFGGCDEANCASSISVGIPDAGDILGGFVDKLVASVGSVFADSGFSISNDAYSEDDDRRVEFMASSNPWPVSFSFDAPEDSESIGDCDGMFGDLEAGVVYEASTDCVEDGLANGSSYTVSGDGVAVVYINDSDTLNFEGNFTSSNDNRVLFVTQGSVVYDETIGEAAPTTSTSPQVQAAVIAEQSITFSTTGSQDDTTIVVEGPLVSKDGEVAFDRDRGLQNGYPAEVVVYNPTYLIDLNRSTPAGVSSVDISWVIEN